MGPIGPLELGIVLLIVLLIFGPKRLPEMGKSLGKGMREFKDSITGKDDDKEVAKHHELPAPAPVVVTATTVDEPEAGPVAVAHKPDTTS
jgi:sec-independent protein translocase protein TatA